MRHIDNPDNSNPLHVGPHIFFRSPPAYVDAKALTAGVAETLTVPTDARHVVFSATEDFFAKTGGTATVPGDTSNGTASELNPVGYTVKGGETISVITAAATAIVTMSVYYK